LEPLSVMDVVVVVSFLPASPLGATEDPSKISFRLATIWRERPARCTLFYGGLALHLLDVVESAHLG